MTPRPITVGLLANAFRRAGGVETHVVDLAALLRDAGHEVVVVAAMVDPLRGGQPPVTVLPDLDRRRVAAESVEICLRALRSADVDLVHLHAIEDPGLIAALREEWPTVISIHNHPGCSSGGLKYFGSGRACVRPHGPACLSHALLQNCGHHRLPRASPASYRAVSRFLGTLRRADAVVAYSHYMVGHLAANGIPGVSLVPLFIPIPGSRTPVPTERRIVFAGRLKAYKGADLLLRAMEGIDAVLEIHGTGPARGELAAQARRAGIGDRVEFMGWSDRPELQSAFERARVATVPSRVPESFGLVGLWAMMHSRPAVASSSGGTADWCEHEVTGLRVAPGNHLELRRALVRLLDEPGLAERMGAAAHRRAMTAFTPQHHLDALLRVYDQAIARFQTV
jgi:glycosyltransferase involved in cell wall biosynthesis